MIVSKHTYLADLVTECGGGLVTDNSVEDLVRCFEVLLKDPEQCAQMGRKGQEFVEKKLNWSEAFKNLHELYQQHLDISL